MRIRVLPLPPETVGDTTTTPYGIVVDQLSAIEGTSLTAQFDAFREISGARFVIGSAAPVELDESALAVDVDELLTALTDRGLQVAR